MKTINEIQDDELVFDERNDSQIYASDLKHEWNSLNEDERSCWKTLKERTIKLSAESVLDCASEEFKQRMQGLLDEISNFPSAKVYDIDEDINPFTNWKVSR